MKIKTTLLIALCTLGIHFAHAQSEMICFIQYSYDAAGNRTLRQYICKPGKGNPNRNNDSTSTSKTNTPVDSFQIVSIIPNPTSGPVTIICNEDLNNAALIVTDMNGKTVEQSTINGYNIQMDISKLAPGAYNVSVVSNGTPTTRTLIKMSVH